MERPWIALYQNSSKLGTVAYRLLSVPVTIVAVAIVYFFKIPNPMMILIIAVVLFAYLDGYISGLLSGCTAAAYSAYFFYIATADKVAGEKLVTILLAISSIIILVGKLKARDNRIIAKLEQTQGELVKEKKHAEELSRSKSDFISSMSHEMRTPLNAITGLTYIAMKSKDNDKVLESLSKINDASMHLLGVINDTLDISKIEAGKFELSTSAFVLEQMLNRVARVCQFHFDQKKHNFTITVARDVPAAIITDQQRLAQVITNLLSNAAKFTPDGGKISLFVHLQDGKEDVATILFEVEDEGIGMTKEHMAKLFQPFEQGDGRINRQFGGTGLGLVICKRIVEFMGGTIWVESELGKGTRFVFSIKARRGDVEHANWKGNDTFNSMESYANKFAGKRLLLVDDVKINREIVLSLLDGTGLTVDCAENGREALALMEVCPDIYDIVFMDVQMPVMDGLEATRRIRALPMPKRLEIPIIAMTAKVFKEDIESCLNAGMNDHIGKPLDVNEVFEKLYKYLSVS